MEFLSDLKSKLAGKDTWYYYWDGIVFSADDFFSRLDKTYLYAVTPKAELYKIIGYVDFNTFKEMQIEYTNLPTYRITTGNRKGRVVSAHRIMQDERFEPASIIKNLELGTDSLQLDMNNKHDLFLIQKLEGLLEAINNNQVQATELIKTPKFYLCCKGPASEMVLHPRQNGEAFDFFRELPEYDPTKTLEANSKHLIHSPHCDTVDAGAGRRGYPFNVVYGKGVVAADMELFGQWRSVASQDKMNVSADYLKIQFI